MRICASIHSLTVAGAVNNDGSRTYHSCAPSSLRTRIVAISLAGTCAPHIAVKRCTCSTLVMGMMPGMIGTSIPAARALPTKSK